MLSYVDRGAALQNLGVMRLEQRRAIEAVAAFRGALAVTVDPTKRQRLLHNLGVAQSAAQAGQ